MYSDGGHICHASPYRKAASSKGIDAGQTWFRYLYMPVMEITAINAIKPLAADKSVSGVIESGNGRGTDWICWCREEYPKFELFRRACNRQRHAALIPHDIRVEDPKLPG